MNVDTVEFDLVGWFFRFFVRILASIIRARCDWCVVAIGKAERTLFEV